MDQRRPSCHPERRYYAKDFCGPCYNRQYFKRYYADPVRRSKIIALASENGKRWYASLRDRAIDKLGGRCTMCGISDRRVLCLDHINGDGYKERGDPKTLFHQVLSGRKDIQLLCANCNMIKAQENGETRRGPTSIHP
jgi:hypothetical protein